MTPPDSKPYAAYGPAYVSVITSRHLLRQIPPSPRAEEEHTAP